MVIGLVNSVVDKRRYELASFTHIYGKWFTYALLAHTDKLSDRTPQEDMQRAFQMFDIHGMGKLDLATLRKVRLCVSVFARLSINCLIGVLLRPRSTRRLLLDFNWSLYLQAESNKRKPC